MYFKFLIVFIIKFFLQLLNIKDWDIYLFFYVFDYVQEMGMFMDFYLINCKEQGGIGCYLYDFVDYMLYLVIENINF